MELTRYCMVNHIASLKQSVGGDFKQEEMESCEAYVKCKKIPS
jgi:hypothetical protein